MPEKMDIDYAKAENTLKAEPKAEPKTEPKDKPKDEPKKQKEISLF